MHPQRYLVMLALCGLLTGPTSAAAKCVVRGKATLTVRGKAKVAGEKSKVRGGGKAHMEGWEVHTRGVFRTRIGSFTRQGPVVERALSRARPMDFGDGRASVKRGAFEKYTFTWDPAQCTTSEAALGAIHLTWYLDEQMAER